MSPGIGATQTPSTAERDRSSHSRTALNGPQRRRCATALRSDDTEASRTRLARFGRSEPKRAGDDQATVWN
jgi:hypothetical protein